MAWKLLNAASLTALCTIIKQIKATAGTNTSSISGLSEDLSELATQTAAALTETDAALETMDNAKQDKSDSQTVTLAVSGWTENTDSESRAAGYAYVYDAAIADATTADGAEAVIDIPSMETAIACGLCSTCVVSADSIRYYAVDAPTAEITMQVRLIKA